MIARTGRAQPGAPYTLSAERLSSGSTLGSPTAVLVLKANGAVEKIYSPQAGADVFGSIQVRHWDARGGTPLMHRENRVVIAPEREEHRLEFGGGIESRERVFVLHSAPRGTRRHELDPPAAYYEVELYNAGEECAELVSYAAVRLRGSLAGETEAVYDDGLAAFVVRSTDRPDAVRVAACSIEPAGYETTTDIAKGSGAHFPGALRNETIGSADDPVALFEVRTRLEPAQRASFYFTFTFSLAGEAEARAALRAVPDATEALERTQSYYAALLDYAVVMTPDPQINRGALWAKVNILRSLLLTQLGWCFVNDPTETTHSVARDTSWFAFGADYVVPWFVRDSLDWFAEHLTADGMVVEWYDNRSGETQTDGLDMNDNTPLLILALRHHFCVSGDREFLRQVFPQVLRAARYIVSKRGERGLVWCHAPGRGGRGVVGWRNAITGYRLAGATTELNSECYAAFRAAALMAEELGDPEVRQELDRQAAQLRTAINHHLLDRSRKLYYLTIDEKGVAWTDVTSDLVFPVLFGVAERDVATHIIATLSAQEFWSAAGLHTVPRDALNYSPVEGSGLLGGVWAGPTFWFAAAAARYDAELMARALSIAFRHYAEDPLRYDTVPGQFCEWLHGETLTNQGMMLSPWFAPKYLWAAIEGAAGLVVDVDPLEIRARIPADWGWIAVRNVVVRGTPLSWFTVRVDGLVTYATDGVASIDPSRRYARDVSASLRVVGDGIAAIALQRGGETAILLGNTLDRSVCAAVRVDDSLLAPLLRVRAFDSLAGRWEENTVGDDDFRRGLSVELGRRGFRVLELSQAGTTRQRA